MLKPRSLVLRAPGSNCDEEAAAAWERAGASAEIRHVGAVFGSPKMLDDFQLLTIPGGFSYGDDLGAGRILAARLAGALGDALSRFRDRGGLILGICNGFQVLVKAGLLPGGTSSPATVAGNDSGRFEARWVRLLPMPGFSPFVSWDGPIELPVAHGEGRYVSADASAGQVVLRYADEHNRATQAYPANPNGAPDAVAGLCDATGRVFGLMPHPERFIDGWHHPRWTREGIKAEGDGLRVFRGAVESLR